MNFNFAAPITIVASVAALAPAHAATVQPFSPAAFEAAQRQGRPILVDVYADWCPTCRAQKQVMDKLLPRKEFKNLLVLRLNFDEQEPHWRLLGVRRQSTLIAFRGRNEVGRSVAVTDPNAIRELLLASVR
jgi:thioredoxin 1